MTSVPGCKDALAALFDDSLTSVTVTRGGPKELPTTTDNIYLLGSENTVRRRQASITREEYDLRLVLEVHATEDAGSRDSVETRMWEIVDELDALMLGNSRFADQVDDSYFLPREDEVGFIRGIWLARMRGAVHVLAQVP